MASQLLCLERPDLLVLESRVAGSRPGAIALEASPFYPGGGGQLPDAGALRWSGGEVRVFAMEKDADGRLWHLLEPGLTVPSEGEVVEAAVDAGFRGVMRELHTGLHLVNALVFQAFDGALVTGVQMAGDGTARIDFDLPDADNDRLRALEPAINDAIRRDLPVASHLVPFAQAQAEPGTLRSKAVMPRSARTASCAWSRSRAWIGRPAAARTWRAPARAAPSVSSRWRTRAATTAGSASAWKALDPVPDGGATVEALRALVGYVPPHACPTCLCSTGLVVTSMPKVPMSRCSLLRYSEIILIKDLGTARNLICCT